jgi:hypothetical protein
MILMLLSLLSPAEAGSAPYMWGVGPTINTIVYPGSHPLSFPSETRDEETNKTLLDKTKGDMGIGAHGVLYMGKTQRVGSHAWYSFGAGGFRSTNLTLEYDFAGTDQGGVAILGGFGAGVGHQRWQTNDVGEIKMATYMGRAQGTVTYRTRRQAYEIGTYFLLTLPGKQMWNPSGDAEEEQVKGGVYPTLGLEATVYFGDFKAPTSKKKKKKKKKKK